MLLTPEFGPRVRFGSIFTAAELPSDPLLDLDLCTRCMRCVRMCPAAALNEQDYPAGDLAVRDMHQGLSGGRGPEALRARGHDDLQKRGTLCT
jgi:epoxyqueuosine reductase QueG